MEWGIALVLDHADYYALDYWQLIVNFAFSKSTFVVIFLAIGAATIIISLLFWIVVRVTTHLQRPPILRFWGFFSLIAPPATAGTILGMIPATLVLATAFMLLKGYIFVNPEKEGEWILDTYFLHWYDAKLDPNVVKGGRMGRMGFCVLVVGILSIFTGSNIFVPNRLSKREHELAVKRTKVRPS